MDSSGYGGAVAASRLARARQSVCLLERGKERWPGEYPTTEVDFIRDLRIAHYAGKRCSHIIFPLVYKFYEVVLRCYK